MRNRKCSSHKAESNFSSGVDNMVKKSILTLATFALAVASAASSYNVSFVQSVVVNGQTLKPGDYKIQVKGDKATLQRGREVTEVAVKVESNESKYSTTSVRMNGSQIEEIRLGGTNTKLVFEKT